MHLAARLSCCALSSRLLRALPSLHRPSFPLHESPAQPMGGALSRLPGGGALRRGASRLHAAKAERPSEEDPDLWMIIGLGNPGARYVDTRHNVGFMLVDALAAAEGIAVDRLQETAQVGRGRLCGKKVLLAKPLTFMNVSGESVGKLARFYRIPVERVFVVYDDLDLPTAQVRLRAKGGHGGHNGMKSISQHLGGSKDFPRLRIGIGRPDNMSIASYVLQDFSKAERQEIDLAVQEGLDVVRAVLTLGMEKAVSGMRVDRNGNTITPQQPSSVQPQPGKQQQRQQPANGKQQQQQQQPDKLQKAQSQGPAGKLQQQLQKAQQQGSAGKLQQQLQKMQQPSSVKSGTAATTAEPVQVAAVAEPAAAK